MSNADCGGALVCNQAAFGFGACVGNCATGGATCVPDSRFSECQTDILSPSYGSCVSCVSDQECVSAGTGTYCTPYNGCQDCRNDADCAATPSTPVCAGVCVGCVSFHDCAPGQACDAASFTCGTSCSLDQDCPSGTCTNGTCG